MRFDEIDGDVVEEPSALAAAGRATKRAGLLGFGDELQAGLEHTFPRLALTPGEFFDPSVPTPAAQSYTQARNNARAVDDITHEAHPYVSNAVEFGVGLVHPINKVGGKGLIGAMKGGALQGGIQGLGDSRADLTDGDIENYARAFQDTSNGANYGAAFGAVGHGVGYGVRGLGRKVGGAIDSARESLFREEAERGARELAEADAPRIAQREAEAAKAAKERAAIDKAHGDALQKNKEMNARAAKEAERAAQRGAVRQGSARPFTGEEPGTATLGAYEGGANRRWRENYGKVKGDQKVLAGDEPLAEAERARLQRYVDKNAAAVDNPGEYQRQIMREEMIRRGYPRDMVDRIMAERVGPDGSIRSRGETPTVAADLSDFQKNGWAERAPRAGGGGSAWEGGYTPFSERPTQVALVRTSPPEGFGGIAEHPVHTFEFTPKGAAEPFEVVAMERAPGEVYVESVKPVRASNVQELHGEMANKFGPGAMKDMFREIARAFPGTERISGQRMTGANIGHEMNVRAPEVTRSGVPDFEATQAGRPDFSGYEVPHGSPMFREDIAREVEREGLDAPHWQRPREPGERPLTPYENAQLEAQNRRMAPDEDTVPQYGYPPKEQFRYQQRLPEDVDFQAGEAAPAERPPVLAPMPARRPAGEGLFDVANKAPAAVHEAPTRGGGGAEPGPIPTLDPLDVSLSPRRSPIADPDAPTSLLYPERMEPVTESGAPTFSEPTRSGRPPAAPSGTPTVAGRRPQASVAETVPPPIMDAAPDKTPVQRPTWMPQAPEPGKVPLYGSKPPTDEEIVYKYIGSLDSPAMQRAQAREAGAFGELARKGGKAMLDADNPFSAAMRGPWAVTREAIRNPAVRARALSALRLRRLASVDPETWGRVGRALEQALMQGPEEYAAAVHVYNQTDPGFREAQRKAAEGLEDMDDARLEQELRAAGLL